jgi:hypothetical protein
MYYASVMPDLFDHILHNYNKTMGMKSGVRNMHSSSIQLKIGASKES